MIRIIRVPGCEPSDEDRARLNYAAFIRPLHRTLLHFHSRGSRRSSGLLLAHEKPAYISFDSARSVRVSSGRAPPFITRINAAERERERKTDRERDRSSAAIGQKASSTVTLIGKRVDVSDVYRVYEAGNDHRDTMCSRHH